MPVTADGQSVMAIDDKSGNGNHVQAPSAGKAPLYRTDGTRHWLDFDGAGDSLSGAMTGLSADHDVYLAMQSSDAFAVLGGGATNDQFYGFMWSANAGASSIAAGAPVFRANGAVIGSGTGDLYAAWGNGTDVVAGIDGLDLVTDTRWADNLHIFGPGGGVFGPTGRLYGIIVCAGLTASVQSDLETWLEGQYT